MKNRCYNPNHMGYKNYGARGITVCDRWLDDPWAFFEDMGPRADGFTLERTNNDKGYSPDNCYWATWEEQAANRRPRAPASD